MLKCRDVAHNASDYIDENLSRGQRFWLKLHLFYCFSCRRFIRHLQLTRAFLSQRGRPKASEEQVQQTLKTISRAEFKR